MIYNHNNFRNIKRFAKKINIFGIAATIFLFITHIYTIPQKTTFLSKEIDANQFATIAFIILFIFVFFWILTWLLVLVFSFTKPDLFVEPFSIPNLAYLKIRNDERVEISNIAITLLSFKLNNQDESIEKFFSKNFSDGLSEIYCKLPPQSDFILVKIAESNNSDLTHIMVDELSRKHFPDQNHTIYDSWNNFHIILRISGQLADENTNRDFGDYEAIIKHLHHKHSKENEIILDNLTWKHFKKKRKKRN